MKRFGLLIVACLLVAFFGSGCSLQDLNPLAKKSSSVPADAKPPIEKKDQNKKAQEKVDIDKLVVQMVNEVRSGFFQKAIEAGESHYEQGKGSEKFLDTLSTAYGYKNQLEGLNETETKNYLRVVRQLSDSDPGNRFKKVVLAGALIETGNISEGNKVALDLYNSVGEVKPKEVLDIYGWGLYKAGKNSQAAAIFQTLYQAGTETLSQTYHTAVVTETMDKAKALAMYKRIVDWANNALTWEENRDNLASTALINKIKRDSLDAINRIQLKGKSAY